MIQVKRRMTLQICSWEMQNRKTMDGGLLLQGWESLADAATDKSTAEDIATPEDNRQTVLWWDFPAGSGIRLACKAIRSPPEKHLYKKRPDMI